MWPRLVEPEDVLLVRDVTGELWQRCQIRNWEPVDSYQEAGLPKIGEYDWAVLLTYGPLTEVEVPL